MLWLGTANTQPLARFMLSNHEIGLMCQPWGTRIPEAGWIWAADNGCFADTWDEKTWLRWLSADHPRAGCLFATVPDVVGDHQGTLERWETYAPVVRDLGYPVAFIGQDGAEEGEVPWSEMDAFFIGGTTSWKMGQAAFELAMMAQERGKWVHVGRVNSIKRLKYWRNVAHSSDGTMLAYRPDAYAPRVRGWVDEMRQPLLDLEEAFHREEGDRSGGLHSA